MKLHEKIPRTNHFITHTIYARHVGFKLKWVSTYLTFGFFVLLTALSCKQESTKAIVQKERKEKVEINHAIGFHIEKQANGVTLIHSNDPWPNAEKKFTYALVPKKNKESLIIDPNKYDAVVYTPINSVVVTSTTHIPALEALGVLDRLKGFPDTKYISSPKAIELIKQGVIHDLGSNESLNTELTIGLRPELLIGFGINGENQAYTIFKNAKIPVVYNGDWVEKTPLGKAEWIKFFAPFFHKENEANVIFSKIETTYNEVKTIADNTTHSPTVLSGAMYKDVWYLPGGNSWMARFFKDANATYLWEDNADTGSLALSWEHVFEKGKDAEYWISPSQFTSYKSLRAGSDHYTNFTPYSNRSIYTFSKSLGQGEGVLFYELGPHRPDLVLKDLVHVLHPGVMSNYEPFFLKPLD